MSEATLFLVQASFSALNASLQQLKTLAQPEDSVVLMGDAVLSFTHSEYLSHLTETKKLYVLEAERKQILHTNFSHAVQVLSYADWADLCLIHQRIVTLK